MQAEILQANPASRIRILAVNLAGLEGGNPLAVAGRTLPYLQDTVEADVWASWQVEWRDVVILDADGNALGNFNLTEQTSPSRSTTTPCWTT